MNTNVSEPKPKGFFVDQLGTVGSFLCAVHCAIVAFLPGLLLALGLGALLQEKYEWYFTLFAIAMAGVALWMGFRKHQSKKVAAFFLLGMLGLLGSRALEMSSHHHHEGEKAHAEETTAVAGAHHGEEEHHDEEGFLDLHLAGTLLGIGAGILILSGHLQNIKETRSLASVSHGPVG